VTPGRLVFWLTTFLSFGRGKQEGAVSGCRLGWITDSLDTCLLSHLIKTYEKIIDSASLRFYPVATGSNWYFEKYFRTLFRLQYTIMCDR